MRKVQIAQWEGKSCAYHHSLGANGGLDALMICSEDLRSQKFAGKNASELVNR
jgi:hypothetical protein